jgi:hypothetical protein
MWCDSPPLWELHVHCACLQALWSLPVGCKVGVSVLLLPQLYWFSLMLYGAVRVFTRRKRSASIAKHAQLSWSGWWCWRRAERHQQSQLFCTIFFCACLLPDYVLPSRNKKLGNMSWVLEPAFKRLAAVNVLDGGPCMLQYYCLLFVIMAGLRIFVLLLLFCFVVFVLVVRLYWNKLDNHTWHWGAGLQLKLPAN